MSTTETNATPLAQLVEPLDRKQIKLLCPKCHDCEAAVQVNLYCPSDFHCLECDEEFTAADVQEVIEATARWTKTLTWLSTMPDLD